MRVGCLRQADFAGQTEFPNKIFAGIDTNTASNPHLIVQSGRLVFILSFFGSFEQGVAESDRTVHPDLLLVRAAKVQGRGKFFQYVSIDRRMVGIDNGCEAAH